MSILNNIKTKKILVIGDVMLDTYCLGDVQRISPEAPVPVFKKESEKSVLGGAANVAANLVAADQKVSMMTIIGKDDTGKLLMSMLEKNDINTELVERLDRNTTVKTRFLARNNQQVMRLDVEDIEEIDAADCDRMLAKLNNVIGNFELVLLSDYLKGLLSYRFTQGVLQLAKNRGIPVIIDVKDTNIAKYNGAYLLKPNLNELRALTGMPAISDAEIIEASSILKERCNCKYILTTCGARGMVLIGDGEPFFVESVGKEVFDVTGAGDTTIAYFAACMVNGVPIRDAVKIANYAAGIQVGKVGTSAVFWPELCKYLAENHEETGQKILKESSIKNFRKNHKDKKIVFTNGCFDILHIGHVRYLQEAAKLGDLLVIGLNSDESVRRLKGADRPINSEQDRAEILCALSCVDYVVIFEENTPYNLISAIMPDVLVKGGDYAPENVVGKDIVESHGGKLVLIPFVEGKSTSNIIKKIKN